MAQNHLDLDFINSLGIASEMIDSTVRCSKEVKEKIRESKLYLKLLTTIGSVEFLKWLPQAKTDGLYYIFDNFKIAKRPVRHQEVVNLKEVPGVINAAELCLKLANSPQFAIMAEANRQGIDWKAAEGLLPVLTLALKGISNVVDRHIAAPGDIFRTDIATGRAADVDLIDLYMIQEHLTDRSFAVKMLCDMFHIPDDVFEDVAIDTSRRWLYRRLPRALMYPYEQKNLNTSIFTKMICF